jgi:hypothetical protein
MSVQLLTCESCVKGWGLSVAGPGTALLDRVGEAP